MYSKIIACEIAFREICWCMAQSRNVHDPEFLIQGYHDNPVLGKDKIQERIDAVPEGKYDAILIGYGLCDNILTGLTSRHTPLVVPRAHDCITFFLGSKERYTEHFKSHPGTYYYTSGWLEYRQRGGERVPRMQGAGLGGVQTYEEMVEKYGEDNAKFLWEEMGHWMRHYSRGCLISFSFNEPLKLQDQVQQICDEYGWNFEEVPGEMGLLQRWLEGAWDEEDFLIVHPGDSIRPSYDDSIICGTVPCAPAVAAPRVVTIA